MIGKAFTIVAIAVAMTASPAMAQGLGSHIKKSRDARTDIHDNDPAAGEKAVNFVGRCTAEMRSAIAKKILALPYMSNEQKKKVGKKSRGYEECMGRIGFQLKFGHAPMVGAMAEYYVTDIFKDDFVDLISASVASDEAEISPTPRNSKEIFSQCVARKDARAVKSFISTEPASDSEKQALRAVVPLLGQCIPAGEKIALERISLRAMLSFGLYRELAALVLSDGKPNAKPAGSQ